MVVSEASAVSVPVQFEFDSAALTAKAHNRRGDALLLLTPTHLPATEADQSGAVAACGRMVSRRASSDSARTSRCACAGRWRTKNSS